MLTSSKALPWPAAGYTLLRFQWLIAAMVLFSAAVGGITGVVRPRAYAGDALVQIEPRQVPDRLVPSPVTGEWQDRLALLSQQILTAARLRQVMRQFRLFPRESRDMPPEEVLALMRRHTEIHLDRTWTHERPGAFHVTFEYRDPAVAAQVANHLAWTLIELNRRDRLSSASGASEFLDQQVTQGRRELEVQDDRLSRYRVAHAGEVPGQEAVLVATLNRLQIQWQSAQDGLLRVHQVRAALDDALYSAQLVPAVAVLLPDPAGARLRQQLSALRSRYSERYPEVRRLQAEASAAPAMEAPLPAAVNPQTRERVESLGIQIRDALKEQARLLSQSEALLLQIAAYQNRLEQLPFHEVPWNSLNSDHETARQQYRALLEKRSAAQLSAELERRQKDESFRMLEPSNVPIHPSGLNWPAFALLGSMGGLLIGIALAFGSDLCRNVIQGAWELPPHIELLGRVPHLGTPATPVSRAAQLRRRMRDLRATAGATASLLIVLTRSGR